MTPSYDLAAAYVHALTGSLDTTLDWRALSDVDRGAPGQTMRGTLAQAWAWACEWNSHRHGIFMTHSAMDGQGRTLPHVAHVRAFLADLDGADAMQQYERATLAQPAPAFAVNTSPNKHHVYWTAEPFRDNDRFKAVQRRLASLFHGDPKVIDATRVVRVPGFYHLKTDTPHLVTCHSLVGFGSRVTLDQMESALAHVQVIDTVEGERKALGEGQQAPSLEWLQRALDLADPAQMDRDEWLSHTAAWKQAGWSLAPEATLRSMWDAWCERYGPDNDRAENHKAWTSITDTQLDWRSVLRRVPSLDASIRALVPPAPVLGAAPPPLPAIPAPPPLDCSGEFLTHLEQQQYFAGCVSVVSLNRIMTPQGEFLNSQQFNQRYGGKQFIITSDGAKKTDEAWKAATRGTQWRVPVVAHTRFLPMQAPGAIVTDALGRTGVNTYVPPQREIVEGDVTPFTNHMAAMIPDAGDRDILYDFMAHIVKFPGYKIPWAPVIQSAEGAGKSVIEFVMRHAVGVPYCHFPNAQQLGDSGGKFNGWMRNKVFILADEIKVDEKRQMVEVLKPLISRDLIEVQGKGQDQQMEDNPACWMFFTNYADAVPVYRNGRRYAIFYSALQSAESIRDAGMNDVYFKALFDWLRAGGASFVTYWLMQRPVSPETLPMRAPKTTSWDKAVEISRSPIERTISEAIADGSPGFKNGWVSSLAVVRRCRDKGAIRGNIAPQTLLEIMRHLGYVDIGRADRPWFQEDREERATLYASRTDADVATYGRDQGYE